MKHKRTPSRKPVTFRIEPNVADWIHEQAVDTGRSENWITNNWLAVARAIEKSDLPPVRVLRALCSQAKAQRLAREANNRAASEAAAATRKLTAELAKPQPKGARGA